MAFASPAFGPPMALFAFASCGAGLPLSVH